MSESTVQEARALREQRRNTPARYYRCRIELVSLDERRVEIETTEVVRVQWVPNAIVTDEQRRKYILDNFRAECLENPNWEYWAACKGNPRMDRLAGFGVRRLLIDQHVCPVIPISTHPRYRLKAAR